MRLRLIDCWQSIRASFWFRPALMVLAGMLLFACTLSIDKLHLLPEMLNTLFYSGGVSNAASLLQALTGAMVAIATVVFSTLMLVLTLATSQFGHRLINSFMGDRVNQSVLGIFVMTFVYCMLVFHMVGNDPSSSFVPGLSVTVGFLLALFATSTLLYFTHHIAQLISAPRVIETVGKEFDTVADRLYPEARNEEQDDAPAPPVFDAAGHAVVATHGGYVQSVARALLVQLAVRHDLVIDSAVGFGDYVLPGNVLARVHGQAPEQRLARQIERAYGVGDSRQADYDLLFAMNQLAEVAVRALSPSLNNPYTALDGVNRIGLSLARLMARPLPPAGFDDYDGQLRLIFRLPDFHHLLDAGFVPIRNYGRSSMLTVREMLGVIEKLAPLTRRDDERRALAEHADAIRRAADHGLSEQIDIDRVHACFEKTSRALANMGPITPDYILDRHAAHTG